MFSNVSSFKSCRFAKKNISSIYKTIIFQLLCVSLLIILSDLCIGAGGTALASSGTQLCANQRKRCNIVQILVYYPSANFHYCSSGSTNHEVASTKLPSESLHKLRKDNDTDEIRNSPQAFKYQSSWIFYIQFLFLPPLKIENSGGFDGEKQSFQAPSLNILTFPNGKQRNGADIMHKVEFNNKFSGR